MTTSPATIGTPIAPGIDISYDHSSLRSGQRHGVEDAAAGLDVGGV